MGTHHSLQLSTSQCHLLVWMQNCGLDPGPMPLPSVSTLSTALPTMPKAQMTTTSCGRLTVSVVTASLWTWEILLCPELIPVNHSLQAGLL